MRRRSWLVCACLFACVPPSAIEHIRLADGERTRGNDVHARKLYREYLDRYPGDEQAAHVHFELGRIHFDAEDYALAIREFTIVANDHADDPLSWSALYYGGIAHARLGHCPDALRYLSLVVGAEDGQGGPPREIREQAQRKMDEINDDIQGVHAVCTVKPPL